MLRWGQSTVLSFLCFCSVYTSFELDGGKYVSKFYKDVPLKAKEVFRISASNSNEGWLFATSFLGENQTTQVVDRKSQEQVTHVHVSTNCYITRILAVSNHARALYILSRETHGYRFLLVPANNRLPYICRPFRVSPIPSG